MRRGIVSWWSGGVSKYVTNSVYFVRVLNRCPVLTLLSVPL